jgi:hypothetical protein
VQRVEVRHPVVEADQCPGFARSDATGAAGVALVPEHRPYRAQLSRQGVLDPAQQVLNDVDVVGADLYQQVTGVGDLRGVPELRPRYGHQVRGPLPRWYGESLHRADAEPDGDREVRPVEPVASAELAGVRRY